MKITVAKTLFEFTGRQGQKPFTQGFGKPLQVGPIVRAMGQKQPDVVQGLVDEIRHVQVETRMWTAEIIEGVVHVRHCLPVALCHLFRFVVVSPGRRLR